MSRRYALTPQAKNSLREVRDFIAGDSSVAALRMMDRFEAAFQRLAEMPGLGHAREDLVDEALAFWRVGSYTIVYRPRTQPLEITDVIHGARDFSALLGATGDEPASE